MEDGLKTIIISVVGLLALVVLAQVFFFQFKERKLNNLILGFTKWMSEQEKINNVISTAIVEVDAALISKGIFDRSIVSEYIAEKTDKK